MTIRIDQRFRIGQEVSVASKDWEGVPCWGVGARFDFSTNAIAYAVADFWPATADDICEWPENVLTER